MFSSTEHGLQFIKDLSEGRRVGTLLVYYDEGIALNEPLLAIPINLAATLQLDQSVAYIGFTASTGNLWQKQDILSWGYCAEVYVL